MIDLIASILFSGSLLLFFRWAKKADVPLLPMLVSNYITAAALDFGLEYRAIDQLTYDLQTFSYLLLGFLFIGSFFLMGLTAQVFGVATAGIASKLSLLLPVTLGILFFGDPLTAGKACALIITLVAVGFTIGKEKMKMGVLPVVLFLGCGLVDVGITLVSKGVNPSPLFEGITFLGAGLGGILYILFFGDTKTKRPSIKAIWMGIGLGTCNYASLVFMVRALKTSGLNTSTFFPVNNMGVILFGFLAGWILFNEPVKRNQMISLALSLLALFLLYGDG